MLFPSFGLIPLPEINESGKAFLVKYLGDAEADLLGFTHRCNRMHGSLWDAHGCFIGNECFSRSSCLSFVSDHFNKTITRLFEARKDHASNED